MTWLIPIAAAVAALFDVQPAVLMTEEAHVFAAQADAPECAAVYVLDGRSVRAFEAASPGPPRTINLPEGTSAVDVADTDADGAAEVLAIDGRRVLEFELFGEEAGASPRVLFQTDTQLTAWRRPYLHVLAVRHEDALALALPRKDCFELRARTGEVLASFPLGDDRPRRVSYGLPFTSRTLPAPRFSGPGALEGEAARLLEYEPDLPLAIHAPFDAPENAHEAGRRGTPLQVREAGQLDPAQWPWFPLDTGDGPSARVYYAAATRAGCDTRIVVAPAPGGPWPHESRRIDYPGALLDVQHDAPDFNGDGYVDLLLWQMPDPGLSVHALTRAALAQTWPLTLAVRLYQPGEGRFSPRPSSQLTFDAPVSALFGLLSGAPVRHAIVRDFNGDGRSDLAFSPEPGAFEAWACGEEGFANTPDFLWRGPADLDGVALCQALCPGQPPTLVVRGGRRLAIFRPQAGR